MLLYLILCPISNLFLLNSIATVTINIQRFLTLIFNIAWQFIAMYILWCFNSSGVMFQNTILTTFNMFGSNFILSIDSISIWLILLTTFLTPISCLLISTKNSIQIKNLTSLVLILNFCMILCFLVQDILVFYIIFEVSLIPLYFMILIAGSGYRYITAGYRLIYYTFISSLLMLISIILIYTEINTFNYYDMIEANFSFNRQILIYLPIVIVFLVKLPVIPFHSWLPLAHVSAPTVGSVLLAGIVLKLGAYGLIKYSLIPFYQAWIYYSPFILMISIISLLYSSLITLAQLDLKTIVAYSSIAHMSTVLLVLSTNIIGSISVSNLMLVSHGIVSPGLFMCVGYIYDRYHTKFLNYLVGSGHAIPNWTAVFYLLTLANCSIPLSLNFIAEYLIIILTATLNINIAIIVCLCLIIPGIFGFWSYSRVLSGLSRLQFVSDLTRIEFYVIIQLIIGFVLLGIFPNIIIDSTLNFDIYAFNLK